MADPLQDQADEYATKLKAQYGGQGGAPIAPLGQGAPATPYDAQASEYAQKLQAQYGTGAKTAASTDTSGVLPGNSGGQWGASMNILNAINFGYAPQIQGFANAVGGGLSDVLHGAPVSTALSNAADIYYPQSRDIYTAARNDWQQSHPFLSAVTSVGGGTIGGLLPVGAEAAAGNALARTLPTSIMESPTLRWLAGYGGDSAATRLTSKGLLGARQGVENEALQNEPESHKNYLMAAGLGAGTGMATHGLVTAPYTKGMDMGIDPVVQANARALQDQGLNVQGGALSKDLPAPNYSPEDLANTTRAINRTAGLDSDRLTVAGINNHLQNVLGPHLDDIATRAGGVPMFGAPGAPSVAGDLSDIRTRMAQDPNLVDLNIRAGTPQPLDNKYPRIMSVISKVENSMDPSTGQIPGDQYVNLTRSGKAKGEVQMLANDPDPNIAQYGQAIRQALSDGLDRSAPPGLKDELAQTRLQYKNAKILQGIAPQAERDSAGFIDPTKLQGPIRASYQGRDAGDLGDISAGARLLPRPNAQGDVAPLKGSNLLGNFVAHHPIGSALGVGGLGYLLSDVGAHYGVPVMEHLVSDFPVESAAGVVGGLGVAALRAAGKKIANSPSYTNMLLGRDTPGSAAMANDLRYMEQAPTTATNALLHSQHRKDEGQ